MKWIGWILLCFNLSAIVVNLFAFISSQNDVRWVNLATVPISIWGVYLSKKLIR